MKKQNIYTVPYRRKREGKTDYRKRLALLKSGKPRLVVRRALRNIVVQLIEYQAKGDMVVLGGNSSQLQKQGWKFGLNTSTAYLTGFMIASKAKAKGINHAVLDSGLHVSRKGTLIYAALKGAIDGGLEIPHDPGMFPDEKRIKGEHIVAFAKKLQGQGTQAYEKQFSAYLKRNLDVADLPKQFTAVMQKLQKGV
ncbi:50S ribosomal protein L18 [Candidatus Woesearchaeota archaeon]|nr:50S ribosomal protein L18 [Candidatus Woesearchaeota archaeon]